MTKIHQYPQDLPPHDEDILIHGQLEKDGKHIVLRGRVEYPSNEEPKKYNANYFQVWEIDGYNKIMLGNPVRLDWLLEPWAWVNLTDIGAAMQYVLEGHMMEEEEEATPDLVSTTL